MEIIEKAMENEVLCLFVDNEYSNFFTKNEYSNFQFCITELIFLDHIMRDRFFFIRKYIYKKNIFQIQRSIHDGEKKVIPTNYYKKEKQIKYSMENHVSCRIKKQLSLILQR